MGVPQNIIRALCAVIRTDHLKFASYGPVVALRVPLAIVEQSLTHDKANNHTHNSSKQIIMLTLCHIMPALCSMPNIAYYAQNYARPIGAALSAV